MNADRYGRQAFICVNLRPTAVLFVLHLVCICVHLWLTILMAKQQPGLLDPETINRAEALGLHARYVVEGYMAGEHKSPFRGFAVEFTQHREYVPGDDIRHLDWKVLGR